MPTLQAKVSRSSELKSTGFKVEYNRNCVIAGKTIIINIKNLHCYDIVLCEFFYDSECNIHLILNPMNFMKPVFICTVLVLSQLRNQVLYSISTFGYGIR